MFLLAISDRHTTHYRNPQHAAADSLLPTSPLSCMVIVYSSKHGAASSSSDNWYWDSPTQWCRVA